MYSGDAGLHGDLHLGIPNFFSIDLRLVKALILSIVLRCFEPVMHSVALASIKYPFKIGTSTEMRQKIRMGKKKFSSDRSRDIKFLLNVYMSLYALDANVYRKYDFCKENGISYEVMSEAKAIVEKLKRDFGQAGFKQTISGAAYGSVNVNQKNFDFVHACFTAAFYPNTNIINNINGTYEIETLRFEKITPDHSSILASQMLKKSFNKWLIYMDKTKSGQTIRVKTAAIVSTMTVLLFAGRKLEIVRTQNNTALVIDGLIEFSICPKVATLVIKVRNWVDEQFDQVIKYPETYGMSHEEGRRFEPDLSKILLH